jgi:hypothetical protein
MGVERKCPLSTGECPMFQGLNMWFFEDRWQTLKSISEGMPPTTYFQFYNPTEPRDESSASIGNEGSVARSFDFLKWNWVSRRFHQKLERSKSTFFKLTLMNTTKVVVDSTSRDRQSTDWGIHIAMSLSRSSLKSDCLRKWSFSSCVILWLRAAARSWDLPFSVETHLLPPRQRLNYCNKLHPMSSGAYLISDKDRRF